MADVVEYVTTCASLIHQSSGPSQTMEILKRLQKVTITIETLKATRIGVIINKLAGDTKLPSNVRTLAFTIVNQWKEIANAAVQQQNNRPSPPPPNYTTTTSTTTSTTSSTTHRNRKRSVSQMQNSDMHPRSSNQHHYDGNHKRKRMARGPATSALSAMCASPRKKRVPKLQQICIQQMAKNPIAIGKIPCELDSSLCLQIYGSLKPSDLKKVYKVFDL